MTTEYFWDLSEHVKMIQNVELKSNSFKLYQLIIQDISIIFDSICLICLLLLSFLYYLITIGLLAGLPIFQAHFRCEAKEAGKRLRSITAPGQMMVTVTVSPKKIDN